MRVRADERAPAKPSARFPKYVSAALKRIAVNLNLSLCVMVLVALRPLSVMAGLVARKSDVSDLRSRLIARKSGTPDFRCHLRLSFSMCRKAWMAGTSV